MQRLAEQKVGLLVPDTSAIDLTRPEQEVAGVGDLEGARRGFLLQVLPAFTPEGTPLGTVWAEILNRTDGVSRAAAATNGYQKKHTPLEAKDSRRWLTGLRQAPARAQQVPAVQCVCLADREADISAWFAEPRGAVPWLVGACQDRAVETASGSPWRAPVLTRPVRYKVGLLIRGRHAKTAVEERDRRRGRETRPATVDVRATTLTVRPPWRFDRERPPSTANVVLVREPQPPVGAPPVEGMLVTTLPIDTPAQVRVIVEYDGVRWGVELLFRTLKSGGRIERRRFEHGGRVLPGLALYLIVAWRTLVVCRRGREGPDLDGEAVFEPSEGKAVWMAVHNKKPPQKAPRLSAMVHLIARLGG